VLTCIFLNVYVYICIVLIAYGGINYTLDFCHDCQQQLANR